MNMVGKRLPDVQNSESFTTLQSGEYIHLLGADIWIMCSPRGDLGTINDKSWSIETHEDGSITVSPSIWFDRQNNGWHGYLKKGIWEECSK
jgi:hypothetical protein